jgi:cytochrome c553
LLGVGVAVGAAPAVSPELDARRIIDTGAVSQGVPACRSCHGAQGEGAPGQNGPQIAHLNADYLERQLDAFATGARRHPVMEPIARKLTPEQRAALSAYFAALPDPPPVDVEARAAGSELSRGRTLALTGDWSHDVPPCTSCHGPGGVGVGSVTPRLAGQSEAYLFRQLTAYRDNGRKGALGLMNGVARRLSPKQLRSVAAYFASLPPAAVEASGKQ